MTKQLSGSETYLYSYNEATTGLTAKTYFGSPGRVDSQAVMRMQYRTTNQPNPYGTDTAPVTKGIDTVAFNARIVMDPSEAYSYPTRENQRGRGDPNSWYSNYLNLYIVKASVFGSVLPTPEMIRTASGTTAYRSYLPYEEGNWDRGADTYTQYGSVPMTIKGPRSEALEPNTKYWAMLLPVVILPAERAQNPINDRPWGGVYNTDNVGRAISFWSNRSPKQPKITSPVSGSLVPPNSVFDLTFTPDDPDKFVGSGALFSKFDVAGVHVQYAARPTVDNPSPQWSDLQFGNAQNTGLTPGWAFHYSPVTPIGIGGSKLLLDNFTAKVRAGAVATTANQGYLPAGDWQIRLRTFDWGHPEAATLSPLGVTRDPASITPDTYPAVNTSPWSESVAVTISAQVPPPIPVSPVSSVAIASDIQVVLTWKYRNTALPPFPQTQRTIRIRKVGATDWDTLVSGNGSDAFYAVPASYPLNESTEYEWQVQTGDSDGKVSNYSASARFWVVPSPGSGGVRPLPTETIDGAALGAGNNRVFIYRRGGLIRVGEITGLTHVEYERVRDDISTARIIISGWDVDRGNLLKELQSWAYEVVIYRENGFTSQRVWEGPITLLTYKRDSVEIDAKDVMAYAYRRIIRQALNDSKNGAYVTDRAARVLQNAMAPDDPNVLAYLQILGREDDAKQYRSTPEYSRTAFEEIDDMAANSGLDYTVVGRSVLLWGTRHRIGTLPEFNDATLGNSPIVSEYGMSMANNYSVSDGNGTHGEANRLNSMGFDPIYGLVEMLSSSWASNSSEDTGTYTQAGREKVVESFKGFAERSIADRYPPPVVVRIPDNTSISADTLLDFQHLVPGVAIPLRSTTTLREVYATQKLDSVKVIQKEGKETINVTMSPFGSDDAQQGVEGA